MWPWFESAGVGLSLLIALALRPWRLLDGPLLTPALAALAVLPLLWLTPAVMPAGLPVQMSGASLLVLTLGWPLAVPVLGAVALITWALGGGAAPAVLAQLWWLGMLPAALALLLGAALRRWLPPNPFVYTLGRGFLGTALVMFVSAGLMQWAHPPDRDQALVAAWLMAWGDAFLTGLIAAVLVAFAPHWLATWSDQRYLPPPDA